MKSASSTDGTARADIYRAAARLVEKSAREGGMYGCDAIWYAMGEPEEGPQREKYMDEKRAFAAYFQPDDQPYIWFGQRMVGIDDRVVALCLMAAILERP